MKKVKAIVTILTIILVSNSVFAQQNVTGPRPAKDPVLQGYAKDFVSTAGLLTQEAAELKSNGKGSFDFWRLTGVGINAYIGGTKYGSDINIGAMYQLRIPKHPWMRTFMFEARVGTRQFEVDGVKKQSPYGELGMMLDIWTLVMPKSRFILNAGVGIQFNQVKTSQSIIINDVMVDGELKDKKITNNVNYFAKGPKAKVQIGYDCSRQFSIMAEASYDVFSVKRSPFDDINHSGFNAGLKLQWKFGRK